MAGNWKVEVSPVADAVPQQAAATYTATISLVVESSSLVLNHLLDRNALLRAISVPPTWPTELWVAPTDSSDEALAVSALSKIHALLDFAAQMPAETADDLRSALDRGYPEVARERREQRAGRSRTRFKRFEITAKILTDGSPVWGFEVPVLGTMLPGILPAGESSDSLAQRIGSGATHLDLFLQNAARSDVIGRRRPAS